MEDSTTRRAWWASAVLIGAVIAAVLLPLGALGSRLGVWGFQTGFLFLGGAAVLAVVAFVVGIGGLIASRKPARARNRAPLGVGIAVGGAIVVFLGMQFMTARSVPPIHDISTDTSDPPLFEVAVSLRGEQSNPLEYDAEKLAPLQRDAYPWVVPLERELAPSEAFAEALEAISGLGLEIVNADEDAGRIEAVATTFWFGFKDDVVVRVRPSGTGSRVDVRSVSRVGVSDLGANAARIGAILDAIRS